MATSVQTRRHLSIAAERRLTRLGWVLTAAIPLGFLAVFFLWPVIALIGAGFAGSFALEGTVSGTSAFTNVLSEQRTWKVIGQTLAQGVFGTLISVVLGVPVAYVLYRIRLPGAAFFRALITVPFVLPTVVVAVAFSALVGRGGPLESLGIENSLITIVAALAFFNVTLVARMVGSMWAQLDTRPVQAANMLGATPARAFVTITLPALLPAIASAAALVFLFCSTSFGIVLILGGRRYANLETEIYTNTVQYLDLGTAAVLSILQAVLVLVALIFSSRTRKKRDTAVGMQVTVSRATVRDIPIIVFAALSVLILHALPMWALLKQSVTNQTGEFTFAHYRELFIPGETTDLNVSPVAAVATSLQMALIATVVTMVLALLSALVAALRPRRLWGKRLVGLFDAAMMLPVGISAVTLGFGLLLTMHQPFGIGIDLRTSAVLIPIAQALVALPIVLRTFLPVLRGIDPHLKDAAAMLGASPFHVLRTIDIPMLGKASGIALGFAFATSLGEFGATSFLVRPDVQTLPVVIAQLATRPGSANYGTALAAAVLLGLITAAVMLVAERARSDWAGEW